MWRAVDRILSEYTLLLPAILDQGKYQVWVGLYESNSGGTLRLPVTEPAGRTTGDGEVLLGRGGCSLKYNNGYRMTSSIVWTNFKGLIKTIRLYQYAKNIIIYTALVFDGKLLQRAVFLQTTLVVFSFCLASISVSLINELADSKQNHLQPLVRLRPLLNGQRNLYFVGFASVMLAAISLALAAWLNGWVALIVLADLLLNLVYSFSLKHIVLIDVMVLSLSFLLRIVAGVIIVHVANFSPWLYLCMALLALFLGFSKRRHEISLGEEGTAQAPASLEHYNLPLLDQIIGIVTTSTFLAYTFYSFQAKTALVQDGRMLLTVPFVFYFIVRYLYLIYIKQRALPDEPLWQDPPLLFNNLLFAASVVILIYTA